MKRIKKSEISVITSKYERVYSKMPRGFGVWAFQFGYNKRDIRFFNGSYSTAKSVAMTAASEEGITTIYVLG